MKIIQVHGWDVSPQEAIQIQNSLRYRVELTNLKKKIRYIAGMDMSYGKKADRVWAAVVVQSFPGLVTVEEVWAEGKSDFPYVTGLLSFREIPVLLEAIKGIGIIPDLVLCDGQGTAHPRGFGIASHLGFLMNVPTVGCAKSRLVGQFSKVGEEKGSFSYLHHKGDLIGAVVRTKTGVKPVYVSPGNRITLDESIKIVLDCCSKYRIPGPIREAHILVNDLRRENENA